MLGASAGAAGEALPSSVTPPGSSPFPDQLRQRSRRASPCSGKRRYKLILRTDAGGWVPTAAVRAVGDLVRKHPEQAKNVAPALIAVIGKMNDPGPRRLAVGILGAMAENNADLRPQIAAALMSYLRQGDIAAIHQLGKCGRDARDAVPLLNSSCPAGAQGLRRMH
jgi:hypothetical protein